MNNLVTARRNYTARTFNDVWKHIGSRFIDHLLNEVGDPLYVWEREPGGIEAEEVKDYLTKEQRGPMLILGPAGLGKTTWLRNTVCRTLLDGRALVRLDVESSFPNQGGEAEAFAQELIYQLGQQMSGQIHAAPNGTSEWESFFLSAWRDPAGAAKALASELAQGSLGDAGRARLNDLLHEANSHILPLARVQLHYLAVRNGSTPLVILDNVDQLPAEHIRKIVEVATQLASGSGDGNEDAAKVLVAMRPISFMSKSVQEATRLVRVGELKPPAVVEVLNRRLTAFFADFRGVIVRGQEIRIGREDVDLRDLADRFDVDEKDVAPEIVRRMARELLTIRDGTRPLVKLIHEMTNNNTRLTLGALAGYIASGHAPWMETLEEIATGRPHHLSWRKAMKGMLLGTREVYETHDSWVVNLFNAGLKDAVGCTIRMRLLDMLQSARAPGLAVSVACTTLKRLFGFSEKTTRECALSLERTGLIEERAPDQLSITRAGERYATEMLVNFEYLQHVVVDSYTTPELVVPYRPNEEAVTRFRRVLAYARWLQQIEALDQVRVVESRLEALYGTWFGADTICARIARALVDDAAHLRHAFPRREAEWRALEREAIAVLEISSLSHLRSHLKKTPRPPGDAERETMLLHLLERRFQTVPAHVRELLHSADGAQLLTWAERLFTAPTIEAVFDRE